MGQQRYEREIDLALRALDSPSLRAISMSVSGLRSDLKSDMKIPMGLSMEVPLRAQRAYLGLRLRRFDLVHRMDLRLPSAPVEVVTVHDVAPLRYPDEGSLPKHAAQSLRRARAIIAPSSFAADDIADALSVERPVVIYNGVPTDTFSAEPLAPSTLVKMGIHGPFILHCGGVSQRKNLRGLHAAWGMLSQTDPDLLLVLAGAADPRRSELFEGDERVVLTDHLERESLLGLMKSATVVIVPSLYEGFGFPAVEAMACGTAVVASRTASLPEICGDAALLCDPEAEAMADALHTVCSDSNLREALIVAGNDRAKVFTWKAAAEKHLAIYRQVTEHG
jgi:glycosyltransferase involved in cell wall biosynthesis